MSPTLTDAEADVLDSLLTETGLSVRDLCRETGRDALEVAGALSRLTADARVAVSHVGALEVYAITLGGRRALRAQGVGGCR